MNVQVYNATQDVTKDTKIESMEVNAGIFTITDMVLSSSLIGTQSITKTASVNKPYMLDKAGAATADWKFLGDASVTGSMFHQFWFDSINGVIVDLQVDDIPSALLTYNNLNKGAVCYPANSAGGYSNSMTFDKVSKLPNITGDFGATYDVVYLNLPGIKSRNNSIYTTTATPNVRVEIEVTPFLKIPLSSLSITSDQIPLYTILSGGYGRYETKLMGVGVAGVTDIYIPIL